MPRFSSPQKQGIKQAAAVMRELQGRQIRSVGTVRNYEQALRNVAAHLAAEGASLKDLTPISAQSYLVHRSNEVSQSSLKSMHDSKILSGESPTCVQYTCN